MSDKLQASIAIATIKVNDSSVAVAERDLEEIVIDTSFNLPSMATLRLHDPKLEWVNGKDFKLGAALSITLAPSKSMINVSPAEVFLGEIVALEPNFSSLGTHTFTIRAYDKSHRLHFGTKTRTFLKVKDSDIVSKITKEAGLQSGTVTTTTIMYDYVIQPNLSDFDFLMMRAKRAGYHFSIVQGKVNFTKPDQMKVGPTLFLGENLRALSVRMSAARQATDYTVRGWDFRAKKAIVGTGKPKLLWSKNGQTKTGGAEATSDFGTKKATLTSFVPQTTDEANAIALSAAVDQEGYFTEADGVAFGHPGLVAGVQIEIKYLGTLFSGKYYVTSATHIYNSAGYETHFTISGRYPQTFNQLLHGNSPGVAEPGAVFGMVIGIVTNVNDPENLGRVKVKMPWLGEDADTESNWARIVTDSAGANRGIFFLPEVNDEVLVAFEHGNMNYPMVLGGLWNGKDKPPEQSSVAHKGGSTIHRMIVSRLGHRIVFDDSPDKKSILIEDMTKKNSILIDSVKNNIDIIADGNLSIKVKGNINIQAGGNIDVKANGNINTTATNIAFTANAEFKVDASASLMLKTKGVAELSSSAGMATVKGTVVEVNGSATAMLKGGMVMIN